MPPKPRLQISPAQRATLDALCNTLVPALEPQEGQNPQYWRTRATDHQVPVRILELMATLPPSEQKQFRQVLGILNNGLAVTLTGGQVGKFHKLSRRRREKVLQKWSRSPVGKLRQAFSSLKNLVCFIHYGSSPDQGNQAWRAMDYPGPLGLEAGPTPRMDTLRPSQDLSLSCDVLVIGSGAGGGMAAGMLAAAGKEVIVLEKGPFFSGAKFTQQEAEMIAQTYDRSGAFSSVDGGITIFAGSCLGGGTTINWTGSFPTPDYVLKEWADEHGLDFVLGQDYQRGMQAVMESLGVNADHSPHNPQNDALWRGSQKLGQHVEVIQRNVAGCRKEDGHHCGYCGMGCREGHKQGVLRNWLEQAASHGTRILPRTEVQKITVQAGAVTGAEATFTDEDGSQRKVTIQATQVIMAAGALHTPAILMRSGLSAPGLGEHLYFHPTFAVNGEYQDPVRPWHGVMMSAVNKEFMRLDGNYGFWIETPPIHPGLGAFGMPWNDALQHKSDMLRLSHTGTFIVLTRDKFGGKVRLDKQGHAQVEYQLHPYDRNHLLDGVEQAIRLHQAAGAKEILVPHQRALRFDPLRSKITPEQFISVVRSQSWKPNRFNLYTAHQMGTCALGNDPNRHPCTPEGQFRGVKGLYVADGSALPSSAGVNPMISIMALAHATLSRLT